MATVYAEDAIVQLLKDSAAVHALAGDRVFPDWVDQGVQRPYVTATRNNAVHENNMQGSAGLVLPRVQVDGWANTKREAQNLYEAIRGAVAGFRGIVTIDGDTIKITKCFLDTDSLQFISPAGESDRGVFRVIMDFMVANPETSPTF